MSDSNIVPLRAGARVAAIIPTTVEEVFRLATAIQKSGMAPNSLGTAEKITIAIMHGLEIGLPPMMAMNNIAVVNGRPTVWGSAVPALLLAKGFKLVEHMDGEGTERAAVCKVIRPDGMITERRFSVADAITAGLWGKQGPWKQYPDRMLAMRARGFAARDGAADALAGLYIAEEMQDVIDITPRKSSAQAKRDGTTEVFNEIRAAIMAATSVDDLDLVMSKYQSTIDELPMRWHEMVQDDHTVKAQELSQGGV